MTRFRYRAIGVAGKLVSGGSEAATRSDLLVELRREGLTPTHIEQVFGNAQPSSHAAGNLGRISRTHVETFLRQLGALLAAGVPLVRALSKLADETTRPAAAATWKVLRDQVADGTSMADAMGMHPQAFSSVTVAMIRAGETGGFLELVLEQIADFQARDRELSGRVVTAMVYPCVLSALAVAVVIFLLVFFIPRFQQMFADFGGSLPALTQAVISISNVLKHWWFLWVALVAVAAISVHGWLRSDGGRRRWERALLSLPVFGDVAARYAMVRFCRMLGTLTAAGVPLVNALNVARESLGNRVLVDAVSLAIRRVQQGGALAECLGDCGRLFPGSVVEIISVAEDSGRLDKELIRLAQSSEGELDRRLRMAVALAEPAMLCVMALVIGTIVVSMVLPIFTLQDYIK